MRIETGQNMRIETGQSEFAGNAFLVSSAAPTCREGSGLMRSDTFAASLPIGLMATPGEHNATVLVT